MLPEAQLPPDAALNEAHVAEFHEAQLPPVAALNELQFDALNELQFDALNELQFPGTTALVALHG